MLFLIKIKKLFIKKMWQIHKSYVIFKKLNFMTITINIILMMIKYLVLWLKIYKRLILSQIV